MPNQYLGKNPVSQHNCRWLNELLNNSTLVGNAESANVETVHLVGSAIRSLTTPVDLNVRIFIHLKLNITAKCQ